MVYVAWLLASTMVFGVVTLLGQAQAAGSTVVSLTFDNGSISQYTLGFQQALQPHNVAGTFFVNSGTITTTQGANFMTWSKLADLATAGNDIGGKTVNATNLTTDPSPTTQVCNDRQNLIQHGFDPVAFAYPGGATNATVKTIVGNCGYGNARIASQLSPTGPVWAETLPPADWFSTRAYAPAAVTLANLQALINGAASHTGGWVQIVIGRICSQALDPNNYSTCSAASGHIELADLAAFLDWVQAAGQTGGAPAGTTFDTVAHVVTAADNVAPATSISCNGAACSSSPYAGAVTVALTATDAGSGVASTHYTTDGSDPTLSSPTYTGPFGVNGTGTSTTVKFRSWDRANNAEAVQTQVIQAPADASAPTTTIACNGAPCTGTYVDSVSVSFSATDAGGSGVDATYYTTDGSTPTTASSVYTGPFPLTKAASVRFFSTDKAGNAEAVQTQSIDVAPHATIVSLTFDNGTAGQYALAYQRALQPHGGHATFFVNASTIGASAQTMTWNQLGNLATDGNDIGGKSGSANLTTDPDPTAAICADRSAIAAHGLDPVAFAYPGGAFNQTVKDAVKSCGYGNARSAGSLSPNGPTYAETIVPKDWFATRAFPGTGTPSAVTLGDMQTLVTNAAAHGGGWVQIVMTRVCSQEFDPSSYNTCLQASGHIELSDLVSFLDWVQNADQPGGAPAGTVTRTVRQVVVSADPTAPSSTVSCDLGPCSDAYSSVVRASLAATDVGSSVQSIHYTTDGSDPSPSSPTYVKPIPITQPTTLKFRAWDYAGNAEAVQSQSIQATPPPDSTPPTTTITCNAGPCSSSGFDGSVTVALAADDGSGWGVDATYYTTDGSTPTTASAVYNGPFQLGQSGSYTVKFFSTDLAGNAESVVSQDIQVLPPRVVVSLTFDDGLLTQYQLAYLRALKPHGMNGTFFNISGLTGTDPEHMTWAQLTSLNNGGNEIGGHTVDHVNLKTATDDALKIHEVCDDRQALIDHGFDPVSFAYPEGAYDATAESIVQNCGYASGRAAGGIDVAGDGAGPVYAESIPPKDPYATRTVYDGTGGAPLTLSHLQASVTAAAAHGGGWIQVVFHQVCSQTYDPANYTFCINDFGPVELDTLNQFLDWLQNAGQPGGAPPRTVVQTVASLIVGPDTQAPVSTLLCGDAPCTQQTYNGSVVLSLSARDPGGTGVSATYFTLDGSTPDRNSRVYTGPFGVAAPTTVRFFSVDNAGNVEAVQSGSVDVQPNADPIVAAAGDIACDPTAPAFNGGQGTDGDCRAAHTAKLLPGADAVLPIGDDQYDCGGPAAFAQSYDPTWGVMKSITHPVPGDKDYATSGGTDCPSTPGAGYYGYFGSSAGDPAKGYYSYDLGTWHVVALNTAPCPDDPTSCAAGSAQERWLANDLATHPTACTLAYYQNPRWKSSSSGGDPTYQAIWQDLYDGGVDVVLNGDSHWYERFQPMNATGGADAAHGVTEFIVGTGGAGLDTPGTALATSVVRDGTTHGVIRIRLRAGGYDWVFVPDSDGTFTDAGSADCHQAPPAPDTIAPATTIQCNGGACQGTPYALPVSVTLAATDNTGGSGVDKTYYTTDGSTPTTSSTVYSGPFQVATTTTVRYFSTDKAGNAEAPGSQQIQVDGTPPTTVIQCNGGACQSTVYTGAVGVSLIATDNTGGSGVDKTYYTTDGSTPTTSSAVYSGPFQVATTTTVRYFSTDKVGNAEAPGSQQIQVQVDATAPITTITCNNAACLSYYGSAVTIRLPATDTGSGVDKTYYTTNGSTPTTSSTVYTAAFSVGSTSTVKFFSTDKAGNAEAVKSQAVVIDTVAPTTTITCGGGSCAGWQRTTPVTIAMTAVDTGGSGIRFTRYTTNGTAPTLTNGTTYTGAFTVASTTNVRFRSWDNAGNVESTKSQNVRIDAAAPTVSITAPANGASIVQGAKPTLSASASDTGTGSGAASGVASVAFYLDGTTLIATDKSSPYSTTWNTRRVALGSHTLTAVATDTAGNTASATITVTITP